MVPERTLVGGAIAVVLLSAVAAAVVPGAIQEDDPGPVRPSILEIADLTIAAGPVGGDTATLRVETRLAHRGGPAENVTVLLRAVDLESQLVATTGELAVAPVRGEREVAVTGNLTVPREGGYRIEAVVYVDGARRDRGERAVRGVGSLTPAYARTDVGFHRFAATDRPVIEYAVADVGGDRVTLRVDTYLTNAGSDASGDLRLTLSARQADSNVIADETAVTVGGIAPGETATPRAELVVPDGYNYYLDATLWLDGVIVGTARSTATLDPTETISANATRRDVGLEVSDFERGDDDPAERPRPEPEPTEVAAGGQPGFGVALALLSLLGAGLLARRWSA